MSEGAKTKRKGSNAVDRRPLRFWEPFNIWWRAELERTGKRATAEDINRWYQAQSSHAWGPEKPSLQETRTHAKCLRSVSSVRDYFREYRAKKKHEKSELEMDEEEDNDRRSRSKSSRRGSGSRSRATRSNSSAAYSDLSGAMQSYLAYSNEQGYWGSGYFEGTASGVTTAAAAAAAMASEAAANESPGAAAQAMSEFKQHLAAFDTGDVHPGALDTSWQDYQAAAANTAVTTEGPAMPSMQVKQEPAPHHRQHPVAAGMTDTAAPTSTAAPWQPSEAPADPGASGQQQEQHQQQQRSLEVSIHNSGAAAGRISLSSILSPGLHQLASSFAFQTEMPALSPRPHEGLMQAGNPAGMPGPSTAGDDHMASPAALGSSSMPQQHGITARRPSSKDACNQQRRSGRAAAAAAGAGPSAVSDPQQQVVQMLVPNWGSRQNYRMPADHAQTEQVFLQAVAAAVGCLEAQGDGMQSSPDGPTQPWVQQQLQAQRQPQEAARRPAEHDAGVNDAGTQAYGSSSSPADMELDHAAGAAVLGPQGAPPQHWPPAGNLRHGSRQTSLRSLAERTAAVGDPDPSYADPASGAPASTLHGVIPASLLAAMPLPASLPGCPGHSTIDSILQQLEAGRSPRGFAAGQGRQATGQQHPRMSMSATLDAPCMLPHGSAAARRLSQSLEHMVLPQQRLSLYAMGSGMLDMLSEGMDLDTFLGANDLAAAAAAAVAGGDCDTIAPIAPGSRPSIKWLRASFQMQVPELWQQHIQTLQDAPFRGGHGLAPASAAHGPGAAQAGPFLNIGRSSSTGIDALAEAAAAVLAARPDLLAGNTSSAAPPAAPGAQEQGSQLGGRDADAAPLPCKAGEDDMTAAPAPAAAQAITRAGVGAAQPDRKRGWEELTGGCHPGSRVPVDMGPPGVGLKRVCAVPAAGLGISLAPGTAGGQPAATGDGPKPQAFRYILDLATPKAPPAPQVQQEVLQEQQHQEQHLQETEHEASLSAAAPEDGSPLQRRPVVLDLRPEDLGTTSENTLATPHHAVAQPQQQLAGVQLQGALASSIDGKKPEACRGQQLVLPPPLLSPAAGPSGTSTARGALHCGPATAASTTGAPALGSKGAALPAPAMAHVAMAAAMASAAAAVRWQAATGQHAAMTGVAAMQMGGADPAKRLLPAIHEIERMI